MNKALELYESCHFIKSEIQTAKKKGLIKGNTIDELLDSAINESIISEEQAGLLKEYNLICDDIINVDDFSQEEVDQIR